VITGGVEREAKMTVEPRHLDWRNVASNTLKFLLHRVSHHRFIKRHYKRNRALPHLNFFALGLV
jgi:hypothetical protein